jgi:predicted  nucleic acid-binding Zn-ribbon protein
MAMAELAERVSVLESRMDGLSEALRHAEHKAETCMGRQDFLAENLTEVRTTVNRIERTQQDHGRMLENHGRMLEDRGRMLEDHGKKLEDHGRMLKDHGDILRQILAKLDKS